VLEWSDIDFTTNKIRVCKAWDYDDEQVKPTKTWETRDVPIEPTLRPLLSAMQERAGQGLVLPLLSSLADETAASKILRSHLERAGATRADLFAASTTQIAIRLRSFRDIGITWRLWRGDNAFQVQRNAGHKRFSTTEKYVGDIEKLSAECGVPFPALPEPALPKQLPKQSAAELQAAVIAHQSLCERRELNPHGSYPART
jgi:integrase